MRDLQRTMRAPTLLVVTDTYRPERNGAAIVTARAVRGLARRGWRVRVVAPRVPDAGPDAADAGVERVASVGLPFYGAVRVALGGAATIARAIERERPDVVHCATEFRLGRLGQQAARRHGLPVVSSYHTDFARYAEAYGTGLLAAPVRRLLARFHERSDLVLAPSRAACDDLARSGVEGALCWGRCVDTTHFRPDRADAAWRRALGLHGRTVFLLVARLAREKRVGDVLEAYARARTLLPADSTRLLIVGDGPMERALRERAEAQARTAGLPGDDVRFLGPRDRDRELPALYASCDAFVFASVTETLGLVVLEAMASGLAVVAPRAGGIADHLHDGHNGLVTGPDVVEGLARGMVALALDPARRDVLGRAARATAEAVDESREIDRLDRRLRALTGGGAARRAA